jgi:DNA-binding IclR family transcriptional regulator
MLNSIPYSEQPSGEQGGEGSKDSYLQSVPAVDQSIRLLFTLANTVGGEASLTELVKQVGISKSKGLAILNTLRHAGLVTRNDRTKNYRLGPNVLLLSRALINNTDIGQEAAPYLEELAAQTGCSIHLGVVSGETMFVAARRHAPGGTYIAIDVGQRYPLTWGAHGRAYLATLSPEDLERRLSQSSILQAGETARDAIDRETLRTEVDESRKLGYGAALGTTWSGLNAVSAVTKVEFPEEPGLRRVAGFVVAVGSFSPERAREIGLKTLETAERISRELGPLLRTVNLHFPLSRPLLT